MGDPLIRSVSAVVGTVGTRLDRVLHEREHAAGPAALACASLHLQAAGHQRLEVVRIEVGADGSGRLRTGQQDPARRIGGRRIGRRHRQHPPGECAFAAACGAAAAPACLAEVAGLPFTGHAQRILGPGSDGSQEPRLRGTVSRRPGSVPGRRSPAGDRAVDARLSRQGVIVASVHRGVQATIGPADVICVQWAGPDEVPSPPSSASPDPS
jgi:hypothetical protein